MLGVVTRESGKKLVPRFLYVIGKRRQMQDISTLHIGSLIREQMTRKGIKVSWLAQQLGCHRNNIYLIFSRPWIDTNTLMKISQILQHNFFEDLSRWYKEK